MGYERVKEIENPELASATFGVTPVEHSQHKGLDVVKTGTVKHAQSAGQVKGAQGRIA